MSQNWYHFGNFMVRKKNRANCDNLLELAELPSHSVGRRRVVNGHNTSISDGVLSFRFVQEISSLTNSYWVVDYKTVVNDISSLTCMCLMDRFMKKNCIASFPIHRPPLSPLHIFLWLPKLTLNHQIRSHYFGQRCYPKSQMTIH